MNLRIAETSHIVIFMTYSAMNQHLNVKNLGQNFHIVYTVMQRGDGRTMLTQLGVRESALTAWSMVIQCSIVIR